MNRLNPGDIVQHFKRETISSVVRITNQYIYQILGFARHTETNEKFVIYKALYEPFETYARPYDAFMGMVDKEKYPNIKQVYRFERYKYEKYKEELRE